MSGTQSESWLESLPMELMVEIVCHLRHDQLSAVSHVSETIRNAVELAKRSHFDYTTPNRSRVATPPAEHLPLHSMGDEDVIMTPSPCTPPAPRRCHRPHPPFNFSGQPLAESLAFEQTMSGTQSESWLESLPMELLVEIVCHLRHDQLSAVSHASERIRNAVELATECHFNYTTPNRSRVATPPAEHLPDLHSVGDGNVNVMTPSPHTPPAPRRRHPPLPPLNFSDPPPS